MRFLSIFMSLRNVSLLLVCAGPCMRAIMKMREFLFVRAAAHLMLRNFTFHVCAGNRKRVSVLYTKRALYCDVKARYGGLCIWKTNQILQICGQESRVERLKNSNSASLFSISCEFLGFHLSNCHNFSLSSVIL